MNIYVGNISREITEAEVKKAFEEYGEVTSCKLIKDKITGAIKGFGFVEIPDHEQAENAIKNLDGFKLNGRAIKVAMAKPPVENKNKGRFNKFSKNNGMNKKRY
jgi:RNA recognition motif-containing protein